MAIEDKDGVCPDCNGLLVLADHSIFGRILLCAICSKEDGVFFGIKNETNVFIENEKNEDLTWKT